MRKFRWVGLCAALWCGGVVSAQDVKYGKVDQAVVRVLALGVTDLHEFSKDGVTVKLAVPASGHGTGFFVREDGLIITAAHVVKGARHVSVMLPGSNKAYPARVVLANDSKDYAFIRVLGSYGTLATLAPKGKALSVRQSVYAVGYPLDATRTDPQSTPGVVSGSMPDGMLQLAMSVNGGNSGGPIIDDKERVLGIVVARSKVERGFAGLAWAVPNSLFREDLETIIAEGRHRQGEQELRAERSQKLSDFAAMLAYEGPALMRSSLGAGDEAESAARQQKVVDMAKALSDSAEAQLLAAGYFWNRHLLARFRKQPTAALLKTASDYVRAAVALDASLREASNFVKLVLSQGHAVQVANGATGPVEHVAVRFEKAPGSEDVALYVAGAKHARVTRVTAMRCEAPCDTRVERGSVEIGVGSPNGRPVKRVRYNLDGPTTIRADYESRRGLRRLGVGLLALGGGAGAAMLIGGALGPSCPVDPWDPYNDPIFCPNVGVMVGGGVLMAAGVVSGIVLLSRRDKAVISVTPTVSAHSGNLSVHGRF